MTEHECAEKVRRHLKERGIPYELAEHRESFTAQETAAALHEPGSRVAKVVMLMVDGRPTMAVLAARDHVGLTRVHEALGAAEVRLATEAEFGSLFPDCELGAAPPSATCTECRPTWTGACWAPRTSSSPPAATASRCG